jgi:hypothetical protein
MILTAITIAINIVPITGVLLMNQNNLVDLVVPPEITAVMNNFTVYEEQLGASPGSVTFVNSHYDAESGGVTLTFEFANPLPLDLTVDSMSADVRCDAHDFPLGHVIINNPVAVASGETAVVDLSGTWTQEAITHLLTAHAGERTIDIELTGIFVGINGVSIQTGEILKIPDFPVM